MIRKYSFLIAIAMMLSLLTACNCGDDPAVNTCTKDSECKTGEVCDTKAKSCKKGCTSNDSCGAGEVCENKKCTKKECTADKPCPDGKVCKDGACIPDPNAACDAPGQSCKAPKICCDLGNGKGKSCNFKRCLVDDDCTAGKTKNTCAEPVSCADDEKAACVQGVCKCQAPCGGADCGSGKCCDVKQDLCVDNPKPCPDLKCPDGFDPPDAKDFKVDAKSCKLTGPECKCKKREPLPLGEVGEYSEIGLSGGKVVVSAYNKTYGDLMVGTRQTDGKFTWEFVDGVPSGAKPTGATDGPRGGVADKGDDVGYYTSLAVAKDGSIHVAYHDKTNGTLKYASNAGGKWKHHVVDKIGKGIGRYTSITIAGGNPVIAYFVTDDGKGKGGLRIARGNVATPTADSDWQVTPLASEVIPTCGGKCGKDEFCVRQGPGKYGCSKPTAKEDQCKPKACTKDVQICVNNACLNVIDEKAKKTLPPGTGLFVSIAALANGGVVLSFYNSVKEDLLIALQASPSAKFTQKTLKTAGNVGQFPSVAVDATGKVHLAYVDAVNDIRYIRLSKTLVVELEEVVDNGVNPLGDHLLTETSIALDGSNQPRIVYQDATNQDLKIAVRTGAKAWKKQVIAKSASNPYQGAYGFFADQVISGGVSYISNFRYNLRDPKNPSFLDIRTWKP